MSASKQIYRIKAVMLLFLFPLIIFLNGCSFITVRNETDKHVGKEMVYNQPMIYITNIKDKFGGPTHSSSKENRLLIKLNQPIIFFHDRFKDSIKKVSYVKSTMKFTVIGKYNVMHFGLFAGHDYQMYELKDENGVVSSVLKYDVQKYDPEKQKKRYFYTPTCNFNYNYSIDESILDSIYGTGQQKTIRVVLDKKSLFSDNLNDVRENFFKNIAHYNYSDIKAMSVNDSVITLKADADLIAYLYTSSLEMGIKRMAILD